MKTRSCIGGCLLALITLLTTHTTLAAGLQPINGKTWNQAAVRKVLHTFAYGGFATDQQINAWAKMSPQKAIREILSFDAVNEKLSPIEDATADFGPGLWPLQEIWSVNDSINPTCPGDVDDFSPTRTRKDEKVTLSNTGLQNTWIAAVNKRGLNPVANKVGFWLVNYQMAVNLHDTEPPLIQELYDVAMEQLAGGAPFHEILAIGATSAAVAREYGHRNNRYKNRTDIFKGNDDFAREFHQLFFRINGDSEDPDYHENTTIEHTAWILTGMQLDKEPQAYGTTLANKWWLAPIGFSNHVDASGRKVRNSFFHYNGNLEVLHQPISGFTAEDKLFELAAVAINHPESLDNLPVTVVEFFADDNLTDTKKRDIRATWRNLVGQKDDLLRFLQNYAVSTTFHQNDTYKYRTAFSRNLTIYNLNTVDNEESYNNSYTPRSIMQKQGAEAFIPAHDVFGGQTSLNAANNPDLFKEAYNSNVDTPGRIAKIRQDCRGTNGAKLSRWEKDWARILPSNQAGFYNVKAVGNWLWKRFIGDNGKNYTILERAHVAALLATGRDFGYLADPANPDNAYSPRQLRSGDLAALLTELEGSNLELDSTTTKTRRQANSRIGMAVNFITMTPFMFATGGN